MANAAAGACPAENTLVNLVAGALGPEELARIDAHVCRCRVCASVIAQLAVTTAAGRIRAGKGGSEEEPAFARVDDGRFELLREIAHGGMGSIVEAIDRRHARKVAIKVLLRGDAASRARFAREVRVIARLQHPSIIPLYDSGRWEDGEPFFSMKLVAGRPLDAAVAEATSPAQRMRLLPNVIAMTEALAYAHEQRVVHRDLKPANVLLGAFGETVVIDWGLAKILGEDDDVDARADAPAGEGEGAAITQAGVAMGTPAYMPPEQARGEAVDARADVYALGALLYHVLAGAPPYEGTGSRSVLDAVLAGSPPSLRARAPGVAEDLVAIVEKAMARDPNDRYADARAMAEDLKRFEHGGLVAAHAYSLGALLRRWATRHRRALATAAAFVLAIVTLSGVGVRRIVVERDRADAAAATATRERGVALANSQAAEQLVDFVLGKLRDRLAPLGKLDLLSDAGEEVERYYAAVEASDQRLDAGAMARRARALETLGGVQVRAARVGEARATFSRALELRRRVAAASPGDAAASADLGESYVLLADLEARGKDNDKALEAARHARAMGDDLLARDPSSARALALVVHASVQLAQVRQQLGERERALEDTKAAIDAASALVATDPSDKNRGELGAAYYSRATIEFQLARVTDAIDQSIALRKALVEAQPDDALRLYDLAKSYYFAVFVHQLALKTDAMLADAAEAVRIRRQLVDRDPANVETLRTLMDAYVAQCEAHIDSDKGGDHVAAAREACKNAIATGQRCIARDPAATIPRDSLAIAYFSLGKIDFFITHDLDRAAESFGAMRAIASRLAAESPGNLNFTDREATACGMLGDVQEKRGARREAIEAYRCALAAAARAGTARPTVQMDLARIKARYHIAANELALEGAGQGRADLFGALADVAALPLQGLAGKETEFIETMTEACRAADALAKTEDERRTIARAREVLAPAR